MLAGSRSSPRRRSGSRGGPSQPSLDGVLAAALAALVVASALVGAVAPAVTAQSAPPAPVGAVAFTAGSTVAVPGANAGDTVVEVSFDADLAGTGATPAAGDFRVKVGPRLLTPVSVGGATDTDAQVVLNLGTTVDPWNVSRVNVTETADFEDTGGAAVAPTAGTPLNRSVVGTGATVEAGANSWFAPATVVRPGTVAVVTDSLDADVSVNSTAAGFVFSGSTGPGSQVYVLDTAGRPANERLSVAFDGSDDAFLRHRQLDLSITPEDVFITEDDPLAATVRTNLDDRTIRVTATSPARDDPLVRHVRTDGDGTARVSFGPRSEDGNFTMVATDLRTGLRAVATEVNVDNDPESASLGEATAPVARGDVANVTVLLDETSTATVALGSAEAGYRANVTVEDGNDDEKVVLRWNTYLADGSGAAFSVAPTGDDDAPDDLTVENASSPVAGGLADVLDPGVYGVYVKPGVGSAARIDPDDQGGIELGERSTDGVAVWTAPAALSGEVESRAALRERRADGNLSRDDSVAVDDLLVVEVTATGLEGALAAQSGADVTARFFDLVGSSGAANLTLRQADVGANRDPKLLVPDAGDATVVADGANGTYWLVIDTGAVPVARDTGAYGYDGEATTASLDGGERWVANFTVLENRGSLADAPQTVEATFRTQDRTIAFADDPYVLRPTANATVSGTATVAPGTDLDVFVRSTERSFVAKRSVRVGPAGRFDATFDLSKRSANESVEISVVGGGLETVVDGRVRAASTATSAASPNVTPTAPASTPGPTTGPTVVSTPTATPTPTPTATPLPTTETPTATSTPTPTTSESAPGFGALPALAGLVALLLAALGRRRA